GTVTFQDGVTVLGQVTLDANGQAQLTTSALIVGTHNLIAVFEGTVNYISSSGVLSQVVNQAATTTAVTSSANPGALGQPITATGSPPAAEPGGATPTGSATLRAGPPPWGTNTLPTGAPATFPFSSWGAGDPPSPPVYSGDSNSPGSPPRALPQPVGAPPP